MKFKIKHEIKGRIRVRAIMKHMTAKEADLLEYALSNKEGITSVRVNERTADVVLCYKIDRATVLSYLRKCHVDEIEAPESYLAHSGRTLNNEYWDKLVGTVVWRCTKNLFVPAPIRTCITLAAAIPYIWKGVKTLAKGKLEVPVLDATAITISIARGDVSTASSVMFLLGIGEILEEWTHKKSVGDLARSMSLNVSKVWMLAGEQEVLVDASTIKENDKIVIHMGNVIPFDGTVESGEGMVNQASMTGESAAVRKYAGTTVYAGTVLEEGELTVNVKKLGGASRYEQIVVMIEESEKLKSSMEGKAERLADKLVPYTFLTTGLTYLFTRNLTKATSVLMVDFCCALKLSMPIAVLSAIKEARNRNVNVKGGKFLESIADADTIVFDKTGTLTKAEPTVVKVVSFNGDSEDELLRTAACLEEHFPHSMAKAVVDAAKKKSLDHEEKHSKVEYIVAHGISTQLEGKKTIIGSHHFVFEDEKCHIPEGKEKLFEQLPLEYSHLYLAIEGKLAAVICIEDPLREEAADAIRALKESGISKVVMMTGDSDRTARAIAGRVGVDQYFSEVLPEDKARFVEQEKAAGRKVIMVGDGVNDSPALSAADVGIAISDGAELAREIADVTIAAEDLFEVVTLRKLSKRLMKRIYRNYKVIVGFNSALIAGGIAGVLQPTTSALLHNTSTLLIAMESMKPLLHEENQ